MKDSPLFRKNLVKAESELESFEIVYKKINENCISFYNDGIKYLDSQKYFAFILSLFPTIFIYVTFFFSNSRRLIDSIGLLKNLLNEKEEDFARKKLVDFCSMFKDSIKSQENLLFESFKTITEKLTRFLESYVWKIHFEHFFLCQFI